MGINRPRDDHDEALKEYLRALAARLRHVRVCCGDWSRIVGDTMLLTFPPAAVFLDPPYSNAAGRDRNLYREEDLSIAHEVREWAVAHGENPRLRIALCGYDGEHAMPKSWECVEGRSGGGHGYGGQGKGDYTNAHRERIWFS